MSDPARAAEQAARESYGRLLALLAARSGDIARAEDALSEAFARALRVWPEKGVPTNPDGWLMQVAKNQLTDQFRANKRFVSLDEDTPDTNPDEPQAALQPDEHPLPDRRLALLMVCAHPAIAADLHAPMMLQTVLGLKANDIARLFMLSPPALAKRLVRAKAKIREARIPFRVPEPEELPHRATALYEAVYGLHSHDWIAPTAAFGEEALYLANLLTKLTPKDPEALGLAALLAFSHARQDARLLNNMIVPVEEQPCTLWDPHLTRYGLACLKRAKTMQKMGRFQLEAAIQSVHMDRAQTDTTNWRALDILYGGLNALSPSAGAQVAHAIVRARLGHVKEAFLRLEAVELNAGGGFQPLWAARADLHRRAQNTNDARHCYEKALSLTTHPAEQRFLRARRNALPQP